MTTAVIVDAIRTPLGKRNGKLKDWHPVDLAAETLKALRRAHRHRSGARRRRRDGLRDAGRRAGRQRRPQRRARRRLARDRCPAPRSTASAASSQQAAHFAAQGVIAGAYDVVVAAGVEVMTRVPMGSSMADGKFGYPFGPTVGARYAAEGGLVPQGISAELIADKWGITRDDDGRVRPAQSSSAPAGPPTRAASSARSCPSLDADGTHDDHRRGPARHHARVARRS